MNQQVACVPRLVQIKAYKNVHISTNLTRQKLSIGASESSRRDLAFWHGFNAFEQNPLILTGCTAESLDIDGLQPKIARGGASN